MFALRHFSREDTYCAFKKAPHPRQPPLRRYGCIPNQHANDFTISQGSLVCYTRFHSLTVRTLQPLYSWFVPFYGNI